MKIMTINISDKHVELFDAVIASGLCHSRSEAMRICLVFGMKKLFKHLKLIEDVKDKLEDEQFVRIPNELLYDDVEEPPKIKHLTMAELREQYPVLKDYKFINERSE